MTGKHKADKDAEHLAWRVSERLDLHDRPPQPPGNPGPVNSLGELYGLEGTAFVLAAFHTFLRRAPSAAELAEYLSLLNSGNSKSTLAATLRYSPEAGGHAQQFDLGKARLALALSRIPLAGAVCEWLFAVLGSARLKRTVLARQQDISRLQGDIDILNNRTRGLCRDIIANQELLAAEMREEIQALRDRTRQLQDEVSVLQPQGPAENSGDAPVDDSFYIAFEDHFRGSEDMIRERLSYYLPLIDRQLTAELKAAPMADIGCGRGEWIGLLGEAGYSATGIDLNDRNIDACRARGLNAIKGDGIAWLREAKSQSLSLISSFHVIEHLTLAQLNSLLVEALRCLKPGGLLIVETPNPENLVTAANRFYTDPSHKNPIPPDLTEFLLRHKGFEDVRIHRLHPCPEGEWLEESSETARRLNALLYGPQDYAAIAIKP